MKHEPSGDKAFSAAKPGRSRHRDHVMATNNDTQALLDAIKANLTSYAVALIAAKLGPGRPLLHPVQAMAPTDTAAEAEAQNVYENRSSVRLKWHEPPLSLGPD